MNGPNQVTPQWPNRALEIHYYSAEACTMRRSNAHRAGIGVDSPGPRPGPRSAVVYDSMSAPFGAIGSEHRGAKATLEDPLMRINGKRA